MQHLFEKETKSSLEDLVSLDSHTWCIVSGVDPFWVSHFNVYLLESPLN